MLVDYEISYYIITFLKKFSLKMAPENRSKHVAERYGWKYILKFD